MKCIQDLHIWHKAREEVTKNCSAHWEKVSESSQHI